MSGETMEKWLADANEHIAELEDMVKDLRAACDQKQEIINADTHIRKDDTARIAELEANLEECRSVSTHWHGHTVRLEAENERLLKEKASLALARKMDESYEKEIAALRAEICSMNDAGHKLIDENERLRKLIKSMGTGYDDVAIDAAMEGE